MRAIGILSILVWASAAHADILHLTDGSRHYGILISQDERRILFRVLLADRISGVLRVFPASNVECVERGPIAPPMETVRVPTDAPAEDFEQMMREAFELIDDGDLPASLQSLQRLVVRVPRETLKRLDEECLRARGLTLRQVLAMTRLQCALREGSRSGFDLRFITDFEAPALVILLEEIQRDALERRFNGRTLAEWVARRDEYRELRPHARRMVAAARLAAQMIGLRLRCDDRLETSRAERKALYELRAEISRFVARVIAMRGYTTLGGGLESDDPIAALTLKDTSDPDPDFVESRASSRPIEESEMPAAEIEPDVSRPTTAPTSESP